MNLRSPGLWIGVLSLVAVLGVAVVDMRRTAPGPLATVHGRIPELNGRAGCAECHGGLLGGMTQACLDCHDVISEQIELADGLHGSIEPERAQLCALCHSEHHGPSFELVNRSSFAQVGAKSAEEFDHALIGWEMNGAHLENECSDCHENFDLDVLPEGAFRFLGLDKDCATCHEDVHDGALALDCAQCHGQESLTEDLHFPGHEEWLPLTGGHAATTCRDCHPRWSARSLEAQVAGLGPQRPRGCIACHESPHDEAFVVRVSAFTDLPKAQACAVCHESAHETFQDEELEVPGELHALSGFALDDPHADVSCAECHDPEVEAFADRYPGRSAYSCVSCHEDPHGGQFGTGPFARVGCIACHAPTHFEPHAFSQRKHERTALPLTGAHVETACEECHRVPAKGGPRLFRGTGFRCEACHADAHRGFFDGFAEELAEVEMGTCAKCHGTEAFDGVEESAFDHARWTGFALRGAHAQSQCSICHEDADEPDDSGRTFGLVDDLFGPFERGDGCAVCHEDPHRGGFDVGEKRPATVEGRAGCARCHDETSFRTLPYGFHHARWTGFPLGAAHQRLSCSECHPPLRPADEYGRTWSPAAGTSCADCHADPHAGQFASAGVTDCARCHDDDGPTFDDLRFLHNRDSRFLLNDAHEDLECSACHFPVSVGSEEVVRYRPLGRECVDCHGVHEDVMLQRQRSLRRKRR